MTYLVKFFRVVAKNLCLNPVSYEGEGEEELNFVLLSLFDWMRD